MPRAEALRPYIRIEQERGFENKSSREDRFKGIFTHFDKLRSASREERGQQLGTVFSEVIKEDKGYKLLYWVTRSNLDLLEFSEPLFEGLVNQSTDEVKREDIATKLSILKKLKKDLDILPEQRYSYPEQNLFEVSDTNKRKIYNALRYNNSGKNLPVLNRVALPYISGELSLIIGQNGDNWGINTFVKSTEVDNEFQKKEGEEFTEVFGNLYQEQDKHRTLCELEKRVGSDALESAIGTIPFTKWNGLKPKQHLRSAEALKEFKQYGNLVLGDSYEITSYSGEREGRNVRLVITDTLSDEKTHLYTAVLEKKGDKYSSITSSIDGFVLAKDIKSTSKSIGSYEQFEKDLAAELKFASDFTNWFYQNAGKDSNTVLPLSNPNEALLANAERSKMLETIQSSKDTFDDVGGQKDLKRALYEDSINFIRSYRGEDGLKPGNIILHGETGIGKTKLMKAVAAKLIEEKIPVYLLKGDLFSEIFKDDPSRAINNLKDVFFYLLTNSGVLMIQDFDAMLGARESRESNLVQTVFLSELQRIKEEQSTWLIADTQFLGRIQAVGDGALLNAHRIGVHREVSVETEREEVKQVVQAVIRKADQELYKRETPLPYDSIIEQYPVNYDVIVNRIIEHGGLIPAQIERAVRDEMTFNKDSGNSISAESLTQRIDGIIDERNALKELQEKQKIDDTERVIFDTAKRTESLENTVVGLSQRLNLLESETGLLREELDTANARLKEQDEKMTTQSEEIKLLKRNLARLQGADEDAEASEVGEPSRKKLRTVFSRFTKN